jgi:hypothetical protein
MRRLALFIIKEADAAYTSLRGIGRNQRAEHSDLAALSIAYLAQLL